jgi:hypothetical protein
VKWDSWTLPEPYVTRSLLKRRWNDRYGHYERFLANPRQFDQRPRSVPPPRSSGIRSTSCSPRWQRSGMSFTRCTSCSSGRLYRRSNSPQKIRLLSTIHGNTSVEFHSANGFSLSVKVPGSSELGSRGDLNFARANSASLARRSASAICLLVSNLYRSKVAAASCASDFCSLMTAYVETPTMMAANPPTRARTH